MKQHNPLGRSRSYGSTKNPYRTSNRHVPVAQHQSDRFVRSPPSQYSRIMSPPPRLSQTSEHDKYLRLRSPPGMTAVATAAANYVPIKSPPTYVVNNPYGGVVSHHGYPTVKSPPGIYQHLNRYMGTYPGFKSPPPLHQQSGYNQNSYLNDRHPNSATYNKTSGVFTFDQQPGYLGVNSEPTTPNLRSPEQVPGFRGRHPMSSSVILPKRSSSHVVAYSRSNLNDLRGTTAPVTRRKSDSGNMNMRHQPLCRSSTAPLKSSCSYIPAFSSALRSFRPSKISFPRSR